MAKDKLVWEFVRGGYRICWYLAEEAERGGLLGQDKNDGLGAAPKDRDDWAHWAACKAVRALGVPKRDAQGWYWETMAALQPALRAAKAAISAGPDRPKRAMPVWASKAIAAGWKPPRGWKP